MLYVYKRIGLSVYFFYLINLMRIHFYIYVVLSYSQAL